MDRLKYYISLFVIGCIINGCNDDFLNQVPDDRLTMDQVFQRRDLSEEYLGDVYSYIHDESFRSTGVPWDPLSDDMDITYDRPGYNSYVMNLGNWTVSDYYYDLWPHYYDGIRKATNFINNIENNQEILNATNGEALIRRYKAEARFLRAFFYFNILRQYGPVIIIGEEVIPPGQSFDELAIPRSTYDESVDYIASELDKAAENLPLHFTEQSNQNYGRATQAMCMVVKSRMLLYAASPLFNGNTDYGSFTNPDGTPLVSQQYDAGKWKEAADAAKAIMDLSMFSLYEEYGQSGDLDPYLSTRNVLLEPWNSEVIFARPGNNLAGWERTGTPRLAGDGGWPGAGVTQQLVDAFHMANGQRPILGYNSDGSPIINQSSGYTESGFTQNATEHYAAGTYNMYANREPRFYVNVSFSGSWWINKSEGNQEIETWYSGESGQQGSENYPRTGYIARKNISPDTYPALNEYADRPLVLYRYAEVLLNYAEAQNEWSGPDQSVYEAINTIRRRAGIPDLPSGLNQDEMRERIRHERRVELALENLRYFDTRRWTVAEETDGGSFYGMNVSENEGSGFYERTVYETRVFQEKYYLFPIYQHEIDRNRSLTQNPGW